MGIEKKFARLRVENETGDVAIAHINRLVVPDEWLSITGPDQATLEDPFAAREATIYHVADYLASVVTVPPPAVAPGVATPTVTLGTFGVQPGNAAFTAGNVYEVAITFNGRTGESLIGTVVASFTATTGQGLAVHPNAPKTTLAASANVYIKNTSGDNTWRRASDASGSVENNNCGFGDGDSAVGGLVVKYNGAGAAPPGASTAKKPDGTTALGETPNLAPTLKHLTSLLSGLGALYFSYSWVTENGETALSPFSTGVTAPSATVGAWMPLYVVETPPAGAVAIRIYAGTAATEAAMKLQAENPIWWVRHPIHSFNASGAAHVTATPTSTISPLQQAYNAALVLGGGTVVVPAISETKVPLIFGNPGSAKFAIRISGEGSNSGNYNSTYSQTRIDYTGAKTDATLILVATSSLVIEQIDFADPNSKVKYGLAISDFVGGQGHNNRFDLSTVRAMQAGGIGILSKTNGANSGSHASDNCVFDQVTVFADAWAVDLSGNQTLLYQFRHLLTHVFNTLALANSGTVRLATQNIQFDSVGGSEVGHHFFYLAQEYLDPFTSGGTRLNADEIYDESADGLKFLYTSPLDINGSGFTLGTVYKLNQTGGQIYGFLFDNGTRGKVDSSYTIGPDAYNYSNSVAGQLDSGLFPGIFNVRPAWKTRGTSTATYQKTLSELASGAYGLRNEVDELSLIRTNADGDLVFEPNSAVNLFTGVLKAGSGPTTLTDSAGKVLSSALDDFGTSFPGSPATGSRYFRTDRGIEYYYDGTRWLSVQVFNDAIPEVSNIAFPYAATALGAERLLVPYAGTYDLWLVEVQVAFFVLGGTALSASHKWVSVFQKLVAAGTATTIATVNIDSGASSVWRTSVTAIGALLGTTHFTFSVDHTKTGTPGNLYTVPRIIYRLVG